MLSALKSNRENPAEVHLEEWITQYGDGLLRLCILQLRDYSLAEDAVQETFIRAYQHYDRFEHRCAVKTWLTTIAINVCRSMQRSASRKRTISLDVIAELPTHDDQLPDYTVTQAVMKLQPILREVILLHEVQGLKLREIAEARKIPLATVASRLRRAKQRLQKDLKEWYFDEGKN